MTRPWHAPVQRLAVVSHTLPPDPTGSAVRWLRLLGGLAPESYCLVTCRDHAEKGERLPGAVVRLAPEWRRVRQTALPGLSGAAHFADLALRAAQRCRNLVRVLREQRCDSVLAVSGDPVDIPAAAWAARRCGLPFYAAIDDDYIMQWPDRASRTWARLAEPRALKRAAGVIALSDFQRDVYRDRYGREPALIYNPCDGIAPGEEGNGAHTPARGKREIVFTGTVYHTNRDAFGRLLEALRLLNEQADGAVPGFGLRLYTPQSAGELAAMGIDGPVEVRPAVPLAEALEIQRRADMLFLPLAFESPVPEVLRTSSPFKLADYAASGRPILVHAPGDTFLSWYARSRDCALVVDEPRVDALADALRRMAGDEALGRRLAENARRCADTDFRLEGARRKLEQAVGLW